MIRKLLLLYNTIRYLKPVQIFFQFYYRLKPSKALTYYVPGSNKENLFRTISFKSDIVTPYSVDSNLTFTFLNLTKQFSTGVNWNYLDYGKLWNYNLQYFNYLHQPGLDDVIKESLLKKIGLALSNGILKLEPYPVSLRAINTIRYYSKKKIHDRQIIADLYAQLNYLNHNPEFHLLGNHLLENAFALMMGGYTFSEKVWMKKGKQILEKELNEQVLKDGGHFELSPMYHQIILFRLLELIDWYRFSDNADLLFLKFLNSKAAAMLGWLKKITFKNGDISHFNDSTIGIAPVSRELFEYGEKLKIEYDCSEVLNDSGYRKYNYGNYECVTDVAEVGASYQPGHSHADALSFVLYYKQYPFLVEAGTSTYQIGEKRNYERSTCAHNTVVIGDQNQSEVWGGFRVGKRANVVIENESTNRLTATHDGYLQSFGVYHQRKFIFNSDSIDIIDQIGNTDGKAFLHFHPACKVEIMNDSLLIEGVAEINLVGATQILLGNYEYANGFNQYKQGTEIIIQFNSDLITAIKFK